MIQVETHGRVGLIRINRPEVMNALNNEAGSQILAQCRAFDKDDNIAVIVLTGGEKAFAAGVDIAAMKDWSYTDVYKDRKSTRLNSSHVAISYAVFCLK